MEVLLLNYVALCYLLVFYFKCKRWYCTLGSGGGRRTLKRLRQSAPQILVRTEQQRHRCISCLEKSLHFLRYGFCYYYGGHANHLFTWLLAAGSLYCSLDDVSREPFKSMRHNNPLLLKQVQDLSNSVIFNSIFIRRKSHFYFGEDMATCQ